MATYKTFMDIFWDHVLKNITKHGEYISFSKSSNTSL